MTSYININVIYFANGKFGKAIPICHKDARPGDLIHILNMEGEPQYANKVGVLEKIDDAGQLHGSWGGLALIETDEYMIFRKEESNETHSWPDR